MPRRHRPHRRRRRNAAGVLQAHGRARSTTLWAQRRVRGGGGAGAAVSGPFRRVFATASRAATALLPVRSGARASTCRARRARPADAVGTLVRVCCRAAPARTARADQPVSWSRARYLTMHCECAFPPTQPDLTRGVAGPTSPGGDEGGALPRRARRGGRWRPQVHTGVPVASEPPAARAPFWGLFVSEFDFRAFPAVIKKLHGTTENRMGAARGDQARRCGGGAGGGRHGEEPRRLDC